MAEIVWTEPAELDVREIVDYIGIFNSDAAHKIARKIEKHVLLLERHPLIGSFVPELPDSTLKQLVEPPCRIFYRVENDKVLILHVLRFEQLLRPSRFEDSE